MRLRWWVRSEEFHRGDEPKVIPRLCPEGWGQNRPLAVRERPVIFKSDDSSKTFSLSNRLLSYTPRHYRCLKCTHSTALLNHGQLGGHTYLLTIYFPQLWKTLGNYQFVSYFFIARTMTCKATEEYRNVHCSVPQSRCTYFDSWYTLSIWSPWVKANKN